MACASQAFSGLTKMVVKARDGKNLYMWHAFTGMFVYALSMSTVVAGFNAILPEAMAWRMAVSVRIIYTRSLRWGSYHLRGETETVSVHVIAT